MNMEHYSARPLLFTLTLCLLQGVKTEFYSEKDIQAGHCGIYKGKICAKYLGKNAYVFLNSTANISHLEKPVKEWFHTTREAGIINRECFEHAAAYTCKTWFPKCDSRTRRPVKTRLCSKHCNYLTTHVCHGEMKRARQSTYYQRFLPICEKISFVDDSKGHDCYFLPTVNFKKPPRIAAEVQKHSQFDVGFKATLKCRFTIKNFVWNERNKLDITEGTWYRDSGRVIGNDRIQMKTKQRGSSRLLMLLTIEPVTWTDSGRYRCKIRFGNVTVESHVMVSIKQPSLPVPVVENKTPSPTQGRCVRYTEGSCLGHLRASGQFHPVVYEQSRRPLDTLNLYIDRIIEHVLNHESVSQRCINFAMAALCYSELSSCDNRTNESIPRLCKRDCLSLRSEHCKHELSMVDNISTLFPRCHDLNDDQSCIPISVKQEIVYRSLEKNTLHNKVAEETSCYNEESSDNYYGTLSVTESGHVCDPWSDYQHFPNITHDYCRNFGEVKPWCYVRGQKRYCSVKRCDVGDRNGNWKEPDCLRTTDYFGRVATSQSGRKCLQWNTAMVHRYTNVDHNYCRNYDNSKLPWCFVAPTVKEFCDIPNCQDEEKTSLSSIVYVVPTVVGVLAVLFSIIVTLFYIRSRKMLRERKNVTLKDVTNNTSAATADHEKQQMLEKEKPQQEQQRVGRKCPRKSSKVFEVKEGSLRKLEKLGDGKVGQLWKCEFARNKQPVLVKQLTPDTRSNTISEFRREMQALRVLTNHAHVQRVLCVSAMSELPFIGFAFEHTGDLKEFLKCEQTLDVQVSIISQLLSGLHHLHSRSILHRDVSARNCFISPEGHVQLSLSGLGMYRYPDEYYRVDGLGLTPVRWVAPELLQTCVHTTQTDVYSFGVLLWEVFSAGQLPFDELNDSHLVSIILQGGRKLSRPLSCPNTFWVAMNRCWATPQSRPIISDFKTFFTYTTIEPHEV